MSNGGDGSIARMRFRPVQPLSPFGRRARAVLIVLLLIGNLFPGLQSFNVVLIVGLLTVPVIVYEFFRWLPKVHPLPLVLIGFLLLAIHAWAVEPVTAYGQDKLSKWGTITLLTALSAGLLRDRRSVQTLGWTWLAGASILAVLALAGYDGGRADVFGSTNPIWLSRALATGVVFAAWMWWTRTARPVLMVAAIALLAAGMIATGSRGPALGAVVGLVVLAVFGGKGRWLRITAILLGGALAVWAVQVLPVFGNSRFATLLDMGTNDQSRDFYRDITLWIIQENPGGVGFGNWAPAAGWPRHLWPHNIFLEVFAEEGVIAGVALVAVVLIALWRLAWRAHKDPVLLVIFALLATEIVAVSVSGDLNARTFWFLLVLGLIAPSRFMLDAPLYRMGESLHHAAHRVRAGSSRASVARL